MTNSCFITYIKRLCSSFGNTLAHFAGDVRASFDMWPSSQDPLQHTEGIRFRATCHSTLAGNQRMDEAVTGLQPHLTYMQTHTNHSNIIIILQ